MQRIVFNDNYCSSDVVLDFYTRCAKIIFQSRSVKHKILECHVEKEHAPSVYYTVLVQVQRYISAESVFILPTGPQDWNLKLFCQK